MNALRATRLLSQTASRRFATTAAPKSGGMVSPSFKKNWLSDPSTYPLIVIMGCAITFMTGMGIHALVSYKDVQINPTKRNSKMQTWGQEETPSALSRAVYWNSYQKNMPEGFGVDHEKWLEEKKKAQK